MKPISVSDLLPVSGKKVLVRCKQEFNGKEVYTWTVAAYFPKGKVDAFDWDNCPASWEETEETGITNPTDVWLEFSVASDYVFILEGVTHWLSFPFADIV